MNTQLYKYRQRYGNRYTNAINDTPVLVILQRVVPDMDALHSGNPTLRDKGVPLYIEVGRQLQVDWSLSDTTSMAFIKNKPTINNTTWDEN